MTPNCWNDATPYDFPALVDALNRYLRLKATPIGMKRFRTEAEMAAVPKIRRPPVGEKFAFDQIVGQSRWLGWTLGVTMDNLIYSLKASRRLPQSVLKAAFENVKSALKEACLRRGLEIP